MTIILPKQSARQVWARTKLLALALICFVAFISGCGQPEADSALDSDANGFYCAGCKAKFYTDRKVFANHCPSCQKPDVQMVVGFVCPVDGQVSYAPRGKGSLACEKCGKYTSGLNIPKALELKSWGAVYKTGAEVGAP